jgi:hypothetical protein
MRKTATLVGCGEKPTRRWVLNDPDGKKDDKEGRVCFLEARLRGMITRGGRTVGTKCLFLSARRSALGDK